jgi:hypothetical protein
MLRAQQFEQGNEGAATLYTETLKQENEKWKKKYMELSNQVVAISSSLDQAELPLSCAIRPQPFPGHSETQQLHAIEQ